eukprot:10720594-Ditylum_brightwellii.AAC.1
MMKDGLLTNAVGFLAMDEMVSMHDLAIVCVPAASCITALSTMARKGEKPNVMPVATRTSPAILSVRLEDKT